ncbi:MAG: hypothetical protein MZV63_32920 [Marinilabiliales bacterium]|nr:hypothetical protein [Marinilabiliales bacterium]
MSSLLPRSSYCSHDLASQSENAEVLRRQYLLLKSFRPVSLWYGAVCISIKPTSHLPEPPDESRSRIYTDKASRQGSGRRWRPVKHVTVFPPEAEVKHAGPLQEKQPLLGESTKKGGSG